MAPDESSMTVTQSAEIDAGWLDRQMLTSAKNLLSLDPLLLGPVARDLLPFAEDVVARDRRSKMYAIPAGGSDA